MRSGRIYRRAAIILVLVAMAGCRGTGYNDTVYPFVYRSEAINAAPPRRLVISDTNFGVPSKTYLHKYAAQIDRHVKEALEAGGFEVVNNSAFRSYWRAAERKYGSIYNESLAQLNIESFRSVVRHSLTEVGESGHADAVVFTDLLEFPVVYQGANNRLARWHGVSRKPRIKGRASLPAEFDWSQTAPAVSLRIVIYSTEGELLFKSIGGLEVSRQIDTRKSNGRFVRRDKLFTSAGNVNEGVRLALHPFIKVSGYPK